LEDDDMIEIGDVTAPFAVVFMGNASISGELSSLFCLLGDDILTSKGDMLFFWLSNSFDCGTEKEFLGDTSSKK
ncbi:unnamed protein product, partial [Rotaria socialis]